MEHIHIYLHAHPFKQKNTIPKQNLKQKTFILQPLQNFPKFSLTPVDQCGLVIFNAGDYFDQLILFHILIYILITDMQWYALS